MGGKYEVRYIMNKQGDVNSVFTNSWFEFMKLRITKEVIYYRVFSN